MTEKTSPNGGRYLMRDEPCWRYRPQAHSPGSVVPPSGRDNMVPMNEEASGTTYGLDRRLFLRPADPGKGWEALKLLESCLLSVVVGSELLGRCISLDLPYGRTFKGETVSEIERLVADPTTDIPTKWVMEIGTRGLGISVFNAGPGINIHFVGDSVPIGWQKRIQLGLSRARHAPRRLAPSFWDLPSMASRPSPHTCACRCSDPRAGMLASWMQHGGLLSSLWSA